MSTRPRTLVVSTPGMIGEQDLARLRAASDIDYREIASISEGDLARNCAGYDYLMLNMDVLPKVGQLKLSDEFYSEPSVRSLKSIAVDMTGMDYFSPKSAAAAGVLLQNIPHYSSQSVSESILTEVLLHSRQRHLAYIDELRSRPITARKGINLKNRVAGIVGLGSIGKLTSELLARLDMQVIAWNRSPRRHIELVPLPDLFRRSDVICICLKTVQQGEQTTVGIINSDLLSKCEGAIVVNLANEALVDSRAMLQALASGCVEAYSVEDSPTMRAAFGGHDSVHFAPGNAWNSDESMQSLRDEWVGNILSAIQGEPQNVYID